MNKKQIALLLLMVVGLGVILFFTFAHFKIEKEKMLENASNNNRLEQLNEKEKEAKEKKQKQEEGQRKVNLLLESLQNTKKVVLAQHDSYGEITSVATQYKYIKIKEITEESVIQEIIDCFKDSTWQEVRNDDFIGKLWQFYDGEDKLILEYEGHAFVTQDQNVVIYIQENRKNRLYSYFEEI